MNNSIEKIVSDTINEIPVIDMHTHLFPDSFSQLCLHGIDELLTYHYLISEATLWADIDYQKFLMRPQKTQAEFVWEELFVKRSPISEASLGVLTVLKELDIPFSKDLNDIREYFSKINNDDYVTYIMNKANVSSFVMTNNPFDEEERKYWDQGVSFSSKNFIPALRVDPLINDWENASKTIHQDGYSISEEIDTSTIEETKQFLRFWVEKMKPVYMAASLPWDFPKKDYETLLLEECVLPVCEEYNLPMSLMLGTKRQLNPDLGIAGDGVGQTSFAYLEQLCMRLPEQKFLITVLARENQYELTVIAQKFKNVMLFGCWWFLNTPQLIEEITTMRMDQLGLHFIPQHSDCRVFEQLLYKWSHFRQTFSPILAQRYQRLENQGVIITKETIQNDVEQLFQGNFINFTNLSRSEV
ncbi:glucuronate isomerase [Marinococcus sp. PL1-022]|uniref:glucuronate isomerase n=1 Tax=Marinococcus sp. PL1-022 TaxID=3095363 RepID=UPI0029C4489B|nr:glucuronate isomerase [Marinococcus sp. PL1-022]MDX6152249.1 glucuronate isomerase [Marinococcus sp. PL1-022]